jgi:hypothetical protein
MTPLTYASIIWVDLSEKICFIAALPAKWISANKEFDKINLLYYWKGRSIPLEVSGNYSYGSQDVVPSLATL